MSYKTGDIDFGDAYDASNDYSEEKGCFFLPHSCDDWVIGGLEEAKQMVIDLAEKIIEIEKVKTN